VAVRQIDCNGPGIRRKGAGRGFTYLEADGTRITDKAVLERIRALAIPPAWQDVWICSDPNGHIQATGVDDRGRTQYRYHEGWQAERAEAKFDRMLDFARRLPALREQVEADLALDGMPRERVLAAAVRLLELGCFRVGGESYAEENGSFGLATIQKRHVRVRGHALEFDYDAKSGQHRQVQVVDDDVLEVVTALRRRRAPADAELLAYKDAGRWVDVKSADINTYLQQHLGEAFSAKDFRTWTGTVLAAARLSVQDEPESEAELKRAVAGVVASVADHLGNTPAVARSAYIDPVVVERYEAGALGTRIADELADLDADDLGGGVPVELEEAVLALLRRARRQRPRRRRSRSR
jgi:DNA topoisomerase-1